MNMLVNHSTGGVLPQMSCSKSGRQVCKFTGTMNVSLDFRSPYVALKVLWRFKAMVLRSPTLAASRWAMLFCSRFAFIAATKLQRWKDSHFDDASHLFTQEDKTSVYLTRDMAAAEDRWNKVRSIGIVVMRVWRKVYPALRQHRFDRMIYVTGTQQDLHFQQLFTLLSKTGEFAGLHLCLTH